MEIDVPLYSGEGASQLLLCRYAYSYRTGRPKVRHRNPCGWCAPMSASNRGRGNHSTMQIQSSAVRLALVRWSSLDDVVPIGRAFSGESEG
jgi:hypothetical protein